MNRPEGISPEAWSKAVDLVMDAKAERVPYYSTSEEIREARLADATAIAKAIQSSVEAERERAAKICETAANRLEGREFSGPALDVTVKEGVNGVAHSVCNILANHIRKGA